MHGIVLPVPNADFPYSTILQPVRVPPGCFPVEVVQFWRGEHSRDRPFPLHWAIVVRTSAQRGNRHEIVGDMYTYTTQDHFNVPLYPPHPREDWRGSHVIGYVSPARLNDLLNHIALVPVKRHRWTWNCQNWVYDVLKGLNDRDLYADASMTFGSLQQQMWYLLEAWEAGEI